MAEELFNKYSRNNKGISAGTHAKKFVGNKLKEISPLVVKVLKEKEIDISEKIPLQLTPEMVTFANKVIVITDKKALPHYLIDSSNVIYWDIKDGDGKGYDFHIDMRNQIEKLVYELVKEIG